MKPLDPVLVAFGQRLAAARTAAGLNGDSVGKHFGYKAGRKTVSQWETGRAVPDALKLRALCRLYGCSADQLLWSQEDNDTPPHLAALATIWSRLRTLSPAQVNALIRSLEGTLDALAATAAASTKDFAGRPPASPDNKPDTPGNREHPSFLGR